ncbi:MAG TPA: SGNH hydrolase domain-containing protein, partial [Chloroflexota bacterium]|nr:SGNH hydrolase domain-containing protein [Chloroflexota bacterium]
GASLLGAAGGYVVLYGGLPERLPPEVLAASALAWDFPPSYVKCFQEKVEEEAWLSPCTYGDPSPGSAQIAVWGDSHAMALIPALDVAAREAGHKVALYAYPACPGISGLQVYWTGREHDCSAFLDDTHRTILDDPDLDLVVLINRAPLYAKGWLPYGIVERGNQELRIGTRSGPLPDGEDRLQFFLMMLERTIVQLKSAGKKIALVYPLPEAGVDVPSRLARLRLRGGDGADFALPREHFDERSGDLIIAYDRLVAEHGLFPVRLHQRLCDQEVCQFLIDGVPVFRDAHHLSATVARRMATFFGPAMSAVGGT